MISLTVSPCDEAADSVTLKVVGVVDDESDHFGAKDVVDIIAAPADLCWDQPPGVETPLAGHAALWNDRFFTVEAAYSQDYEHKLVLRRPTRAK